jgi:hypothetical protein
MEQIDALVRVTAPEDLQNKLMALKPQMDQANESTVCDKEELDIPTRGVPVRPLPIARMVLQDGWAAFKRRVPFLGAIGGSNGHSRPDRTQNLELEQSVQENDLEG